MKITATQTLNIDISQQEQERIMFETLCAKFNWNSEYFIENGNVMVEVHSHGSGFDTVVRKATENDFLINKLFKTYHKIKRGL